MRFVVFLNYIQQRTGLIAGNLVAKLQRPTEWGVAKW